MAEKTLKQRLLHSTLFWNLVAMTVVVIAMAVGVWYWMAWFTRHGESVEVPNVKGMMLSDAEYALAHVELQALVTDSGYNRRLPAGTVLEQLPASGSHVKAGREICLTVNSGTTPTLALPDIADNSSQQEAEERLRSMGFKLGPIEYAPGEKGWVMAVKSRGRMLRAGDRVPIDDPVVLVVGNNSTDDALDDETDDWDADDSQPVETTE